MGLLDRILGPRPEVGQPIVSREGQMLARVGPIEGTNANLWDTQIPNFWTENGLNEAGKMFWPGNGLLAERTWIANRCIQMNAQQIASMPLRYEAPNVSADGEPAWISNPDPLNYPNGISDAIFAMVADLYGWGWTLVYITARYADGYPRNWTVIPARLCEPMWGEDGYREYKILGGEELDPRDVIQIDRNPGCTAYFGAHGTSAIRAYAQLAWGLLASGNQALDVNTGGVPKAVLKVTDPNRNVDSKQAENLQAKWMERTQARDGAPPVLPYGLDFESQPWSPKDMALLETQEFNSLALAAAFGIPAVLLNMAIRFGMTYQNPGMLGEMWWRFELRPTAKRIADAFTAQALPAGQWVWFDADDTFKPFYPQNRADVAGPFPDEEDDPQLAAQADDTPQVQTALGLSTRPLAPPTAAASPSQSNGKRPIAAVNGR